jgi:hypothetical protein
VVVSAPFAHWNDLRVGEMRMMGFWYLTGSGLRMWWYRLLWYVVNTSLPVRTQLPSLHPTQVNQDQVNMDTAVDYFDRS